MRTPGFVSLIYLAYVLVLLPLAAFRSKRVLDPAGQPEASPKPKISRTSIYVSTLISLAILFAFSWATARTFRLDLFTVPRLGGYEVAAGLIALGVQFGLMVLARAIHPPDERRKMAVYKIIPRTAVEWALWVPVSAMAGLAEEAAYRGVLVSILTYSLGSFPAACVISATVFAVSHAVQGWWSGIVIFLMALSMHVLASVTGTLVIGMIVHAVYDVMAGVVAAWRMRTDQVDV